MTRQAEQSESGQLPFSPLPFPSLQQTTATANHFTNYPYSHNPGTEIGGHSTTRSATTQNGPDVSEWESSFGIRFGDVVDLRETDSNFRGEIRITSVHENTLASQAADLLVGIHIWETVSLENLDFVTKQIKNLPDKNGLKFYIVRKGETIFGTLAIAKLPTTSNPTPASSTKFERPNVQPTKTRF